MYEKLNITENSMKVLSLFTHDFTREYYIREVQKILKISPRTAQLILEDLEKKGIVESKTKGKIKTYKLNASELTKRYLVFAEQYKALIFLKEKLIIREIIERITPYIKGIGIVFGSYVKGLEQPNSDLDILIIGEHNEEQIQKISKTLRVEISIKNYPKKIFEEKHRKDILLKEVMKNHVVFKGSEQFIEGVFKNE